MSEVAAPPQTAHSARGLIAVYFVDALGTGAFGSIQILYFHRILGLGGSAIAAGLSIAGCVAAVCLLPFGRFADRRDQRLILVTLNLVLAGVLCLYLLPPSMVVFALASAGVVSIQRMLSPVRNSLISATYGAARMRVVASCRVAFNVGFAIGGLAAVAVATAGDDALRLLLVIDAVSFVVCGALVLRVLAPTGRPRTPPPAGPLIDFIALRDRRYVLASLLNAVGSMHDTALFVVLPLWIIERTAAPAALIPAVSVLNGIGVIALQVLVSKDAETVRGAARAQLVGVAMFAAGCLVMPLTLAVGGNVQIAIVVIACLALTGAELWQSAGGWGLSFALARPEHATQYQSLFGLSTAAQESFGPIVLTTLVMSLSAGSGWVLAGALVLIAVAAGTRRLLAQQQPDPDQLFSEDQPT